MCASFLLRLPEGAVAADAHAQQCALQARGCGCRFFIRKHIVRPAARAMSLFCAAGCTLNPLFKRETSLDGTRHIAAICLSSDSAHCRALPRGLETHRRPIRRIVERPLACGLSSFSPYITSAPIRQKANAKVRCWPAISTAGGGGRDNMPVATACTS
jgi:hypothetical protein